MHGVVDYKVGHGSLKIHPVVTVMDNEIDTRMTHFHLCHAC